MFVLILTSDNCVIEQHIMASQFELHHTSSDTFLVACMHTITGIHGDPGGWLVANDCDKASMTQLVEFSSVERMDSNDLIPLAASPYGLCEEQQSSRMVRLLFKQRM